MKTNKFIFEIFFSYFWKNNFINLDFLQNLEDNKIDYKKKNIKINKNTKEF